MIILKITPKKDIDYRDIHTIIHKSLWGVEEEYFNLGNNLKNYEKKKWVFYIKPFSKYYKDKEYSLYFSSFDEIENFLIENKIDNENFKTIKIIKRESTPEYHINIKDFCLYNKMEKNKKTFDRYWNLKGKTLDDFCIKTGIKKDWILNIEFKNENKKKFLEKEKKYYGIPIFDICITFKEINDLNERINFINTIQKFMREGIGSKNSYGCGFVFGGNRC